MLAIETFWVTVLVVVKSEKTIGVRTKTKP
jgi:hypothetical protein